MESQVIKKILYGVVVGMISLNVFAAETIYCYAKLECAADNDIRTCERIGEKAGIWASATPVIIGSLKKGTHTLKGAFFHDRSRFPGTCDYGSVVLNTSQRVYAHSLPDKPSQWARGRNRDERVCHSSNPSECEFIRY